MDLHVLRRRLLLLWLILLGLTLLLLRPSLKLRFLKQRQTTPLVEGALGSFEDQQQRRGQWAC